MAKGLKVVGHDKGGNVVFMTLTPVYTGCLKKKYPLLTGNRNEAIRYHYSPSS